MNLKLSALRRPLRSIALQVHVALFLSSFFDLHLSQDIHLCITFLMLIPYFVVVLPFFHKIILQVFIFEIFKVYCFYFFIMKIINANVVCINAWAFLYMLINFNFFLLFCKMFFQQFTFLFFLVFFSLNLWSFWFFLQKVRQKNKMKIIASVFVHKQTQCFCLFDLSVFSSD